MRHDLIRIEPGADVPTPATAAVVPEGRIRRLLRRGALDAIVTVDLAVLGIVASRYPDAVFPPRLTHSLAALDGWVTVFWVMCVIPFVLLPWKTVLAEKYERQIGRAIQDAKAETRNKWLVPLDAFDAVHQSVHETLEAGLRHATSRVGAEEKADLLREDIRIILSNLLTLVETVEPRRPGVQYAANLMRYVPMEEVAGGLKTHIEGSLLLERSCDPAHAMGVLYLDPALSNSTAVEQGDQDPALVEFSMYIPKQALTTDGRFQMLPGAPNAFVERKMWGSDIEDLISLCRSPKYAVAKEAADSLERYFRSNEGRAIRSLVCHPLMRTPGKQPGAVLNIHSNQPGLLADDELRAELYYLLRPSGLAILSLLSLLKAAQERAERDLRQRSVP
jgi:hypothetical protein